MRKTQENRCIYCTKSPPEVTFKDREHVIPKFLGRFTPDNLYFQGHTVCDECNSELSKLETVFAEDSKEGILAVMYGIRKATTIRRGNRLKISISANCDLGVFKNIFPFVLPQNQEALIPKPMVLMKDKKGVYQVILMEEITKINEGTKKFQKKKEWIGRLNKKGIMVFGNKEFPPERITSIMKKFDVDVKKSKPKYLEKNSPLYVHFQGKIDDTILRLPAKIAFNYFAYCANQSEMNDILFNKEFDNIRNYIRHGQYNGERPVDLTRKSILYDERNSKKVRLVHLLSFTEKGNRIVSKISLFGYITYEIILGNYPFRVSHNRKKFGCGTCFNPFSGEIMKLSSSSIPYFLVTPDRYELFCR